MAIITKEVNGHKYLYEVTYKRENGKVKSFWKSLGRIEDDGSLTVKQKKNEAGPEASTSALAVADDNRAICCKAVKKEKKRAVIKDVEATTKKANEITSGTTKLETKVFSPRENPAFYNDSNEIQMWVGNDKKRKEKELLTIVSIDFNEMKKKGVLIPSEKWLTHFDREVLCAASSLYEAGNNYITPKMIYQALSGNNKDVKMTPAMRNEIIKSIDKLMGTTIEINASEEVKAGWRQEAEYKSALLPCKRVSKKDIRINGQEVIDCIQLLGSSPLYDYAKGINQISRASIDMLNTPVNNTPENITLKGYLLRTITSMKSSKSKLKPIIRYDTIYEYLGIENTDKMAKKRVRDRTKEILNFWVNEGLITGFEEEKEGKTFEKIKIKL